MKNTFEYGQRYFGADVPIGQVIRENAEKKEDEELSGDYFDDDSSLYWE